MAIRIVQLGTHADLARAEGPYACLCEAERCGRANDVKREISEQIVAAVSPRKGGINESARPSTPDFP